MINFLTLSRAESVRSDFCR